LLAALPLHAQAAASELSFSPTNQNYGRVRVGQTRAFYMSVTNHGKSTVTISSIDSSDSKFTVSKLELPRTLAPGARLVLRVTFAPTTTGWVGGNITVVSNASNPIGTLEVGGTGVTSEVIASPATVSFGNLSLGKSSTLPLVLINASPSSVTLNSVEITGGAFTVSGPKFPLTLAGWHAVQLDATFKPQVGGPASGTLFVSGPGLSIPFAGTGLGASKPQLTVVPATLTFGSVGVGTTKTLTLGLGATGEAVTISSVSSSSSQFAVPGVTFPLTIQPGHELSLNVTFTPQNSGNKSAMLSFASDAGNSPSSEPLAGAGTALYVTLSWNPSTSQVSGYNVYRSASPTGPLTRINAKVDPETMYTDATIASGSTYYYATTAVSASGQESAYSNRVEVVVP
jgi:hypothetical protein